MIRSDKFPIGGSWYAYDRLRHSRPFLYFRERPRRGGTFPLPIERHAARPELRPFSLCVTHEHDAPLALNLATLPSIERLGIANAVGAKQPRPDAKTRTKERRLTKFFRNALTIRLSDGMIRHDKG